MGRGSLTYCPAGLQGTSRLIALPFSIFAAVNRKFPFFIYVNLILFLFFAQIFRIKLRSIAFVINQSQGAQSDNMCVCVSRQE